MLTHLYTGESAMLCYARRQCSVVYEVRSIDVMVMSDYQFLMNIAKTTGFAFLEVTCMKSTY